MAERFYPTEKQLFRLYTFLTFLKNDKVYWHKIVVSSSTINVYTEPLKGEIDIRVFYINEEGEVDDDGFGESKLQ